MPRQHCPGSARPVWRRAGVRLLASALAVGWVLAAAAPALAAAGTAARRQASAGATIAITSMNPAIAAPRGTVTVTGTLTNSAATPLTGLQIQLWSSPVRLATRSAMESYLTTPGPTGLDTPTGAARQIAS